MLTSEVFSQIVIPLALTILGTFAGTWGIFLLLRSAVRYFDSQIRIANLETQIEQESRHLEFIQSLLEGQQVDVKRGTQS